MNLAIGCLYLSFRKCAIFFNVCLLDKADFNNFSATSCNQKSVISYLSISILSTVHLQQLWNKEIKQIIKLNIPDFAVEIFDLWQLL